MNLIRRCIPNNTKRSFLHNPNSFDLIQQFSLSLFFEFISKVFLGKGKDEQKVISESQENNTVEKTKETGVHRIIDVPNYMKAALAILVILTVIIGIFPTFFIELIQTVTFGMVILG